MFDQSLDDFDLEPDVSLDVMRRNQSLESLTARLITGISRTIASVGPVAVLVQGDTTTALSGALAAFYAGVPCGHVEAGLRTHDPLCPFPEEMNRRLVDHLSRWHFVPTRLGRRHLLDEGLPSRGILVTGNTVVDALEWIRRKRRDRWPETLPDIPRSSRIVLVTVHRRESIGLPMKRTFETIRRLPEVIPGARVVYPVHLNPRVMRLARETLGHAPGIHLIPPVGYRELVALLRRAFLVLTDSGGIQEEAPTFGKPVVVLRNTTERPEGVRRGTSRLAGTNPRRILDAVREIAGNPRLYRRMSSVGNPYGDGLAAGRIVQRLEADLVEPR